MVEGTGWSGDLDELRAARRSLRDWAVDGFLFVFAALFLVLTAAGRLEAPRQPEPA